jgi:LysM repeat protein
MRSSGLLNSIWTILRSRRREIALVIVLVLINYLIFSRLGLMVLRSRQPTPTATRTPKPTFTPNEVVLTTPTSPTEPSVTAEPTSPPSPIAGTHVVQAGESLSGIAATYGTTVDAIVQANNLTDADAISEGQALIIPSSAASIPTAAATAASVSTPSSSVGQRIHVVQAGETLSEIARTYGVTTEAIVQANGLDNPNAISMGLALVIP